MIACSIKDGERLVNLLLQKGADVNAKSKYFVYYSSDDVRLPFLEKTRTRCSSVSTGASFICSCPLQFVLTPVRTP